MAVSCTPETCQHVFWALQKAQQTEIAMPMNVWERELRFIFIELFPKCSNKMTVGGHKHTPWHWH